MSARSSACRFIEMVTYTRRRGLQSPPIEHNECRSFVQFDVSVWSGEFTAFRQVTQKDNPDALQFVDTQFIALYPNEKVAAETFRHALPTDLVGRCGNVTLVDSVGAQWRIERTSITGRSRELGQR